MPTYTAKQGQYLAFIYYYTKINRQAPAEADMQHYFARAGSGALDSSIIASGSTAAANVGSKLKDSSVQSVQTGVLPLSKTMGLHREPFGRG